MDTRTPKLTKIPMSHQEMLPLLGAMNGVLQWNQRYRGLLYRHFFPSPNRVNGPREEACLDFERLQRPEMLEVSTSLLANTLIASNVDPETAEELESERFILTARELGRRARSEISFDFPEQLRDNHQKRLERLILAGKRFGLIADCPVTARRNSKPLIASSRLVALARSATQNSDTPILNELKQTPLVLDYSIQSARKARSS